VAEEAIEVSFQLEREMHDRVSRYRQEADARRAVPRKSLRAGLARMLHGLADRLEPPPAAPLGNERRTVALQGRNH
jgi:hypothetical protein